MVKSPGLRAVRRPPVTLRRRPSARRRGSAARCREAAVGDDQVRAAAHHLVGMPPARRASAARNAGMSPSPRTDRPARRCQIAYTKPAVCPRKWLNWEFRRDAPASLPGWHNSIIREADVATGFPGFPSEGIEFLRALARHNRRGGSSPQDHLRRTGEAAMLALVEAANHALAGFAPDYVSDPRRPSIASTRHALQPG